MINKKVLPIQGKLFPATWIYIIFLEKGNNLIPLLIILLLILFLIFLLLKTK